MKRILRISSAILPNVWNSVSSFHWRQLKWSNNEPWWCLDRRPLVDYTDMGFSEAMIFGPHDWGRGKSLHCVTLWVLTCFNQHIWAVSEWNSVWTAKDFVEILLCIPSWLLTSARGKKKFCSAQHRLKMTEHVIFHFNSAELVRMNRGDPLGETVRESGGRERERERKRERGRRNRRYFWPAIRIINITVLFRTIQSSQRRKKKERDVSASVSQLFAAAATMIATAITTTTTTIATATPETTSTLRQLIACFSTSF